MSTFTNAGRSTEDRPALTPVGDKPVSRFRRRISQGVALVVLAWSAVELVGLSLNHTTGPELYGVLVAALAAGAGVLTVVLLTSAERRAWLTAIALILWAVVAIGGVGGTIAHAVGPGVGHGPVDPRPRPPGAPLIFTALGLVGSAALVYGRRTRLQDLLDPWKG